MGLDNGVILYYKDEIDESQFPPHVYVENCINEWNYPKKSYSVELGYWRKCWNIRACFTTAIEQEKPGGFNNNGDTELTPTMLRNAIKYCHDILKDEESWDGEDRSSSIWEYKEIKGLYTEWLENLKWGLKYLQDHANTDEVKIVFYDSY